MAEKSTPAAPAVDIDQLTRDLTAERERAELLQRERDIAVEKSAALASAAADNTRARLDAEDRAARAEQERDQAAALAERFDEMRSRAHRVRPSPEIAPTISALVDLYRVAASGGGDDAAQSYLDAAKRLADPLVKAILEE